MKNNSDISIRLQRLENNFGTWTLLHKLNRNLDTYPRNIKLATWTHSQSKHQNNLNHLFRKNNYLTLTNLKLNSPNLSNNLLNLINFSKKNKIPSKYQIHKNKPSLSLTNNSSFIPILLKSVNLLHLLFLSSQVTVKFTLFKNKINLFIKVN